MSRHPTRFIFLCALLFSLTNTSGAHAQHTHEHEGKPADSPPTNDLLVQADEIAKQVAVIRGLGLKTPLDKGISTRDELRAELIKKINEEYTPAEIKAEGQVYKRLGLMPRELDYKELILDLLVEQIAGFYDPETKKLFIMAGLPQTLQRPTMAHEIFHGLQDQHFDLLAMQAPFSGKENGDFQLARSALFEGDATVLMLDYTLHENKQLPTTDAQGNPLVTTFAQMPMVTSLLSNITLDKIFAVEKLSGKDGEATLEDSALNRVPPFIRESLTFPYISGLRFVVLAHQRLGSWEKVNELYADAPVSTEQIIHPERYFARDMPVLLSFDPSSALPGYTKIYENVFGEFQMHMSLRSHLIDARPEGAPVIGVQINEAAAGWGGDKLIAMSDDSGDVIVVHMSAWDTVADAREYYEGLNVALSTRMYPDQPAVVTSAGGHGQSTCYTLDDGSKQERVYTEQWGDMVLHIEGVPQEALPPEKLKEALVFKIRDASFNSLARHDFAEELARREAKHRAKAQQPTPTESK